MAQQVTLPPAVAAKYELVNWRGSHRQAFGKHGVIDLTTLTVDQADRLVRNGWTKLRLKAAAPAPAETKK